jgi:alanine racemase
MQQPKVRIEDVARESRVSPTAVSFAFNNPQRLNPQTVSRILEVANQLGYSPNPHARALLAKSVGVIGILTPQSLPSIFANPFYAAFYEGVGQVCEEHNLSLLTISPVSSSLAEATAKAPVDGLIVMGMNEDHDEIELLRRRNMRFVIVDGDAAHTPSVNVDDEHGAWAAADHLLRLGHRRISIMTFETDYIRNSIFGVGERRINGFRRAFAEHGIPWEDVGLLPTQTNAHSGAENFRALWEQTKPRQRPTAIATVADIIAVGVLEAAQALGVPVPNQLSVVGYDDLPLSRLIRPTLTTIRQPILEKGEAAAQLLLALISGEAKSRTRVILPTELVIRESSQSPKGGGVNGRRANRNCP